VNFGSAEVSCAAKRLSEVLGARTGVVCMVDVLTCFWSAAGCLAFICLYLEKFSLLRVGKFSRASMRGVQIAIGMQHYSIG